MNQIAVVIPAYNAEETLKTCLDSVLKQSRPADEIIVIDDGSVDNTASIAGQHTPAVQVFSQLHKGAAAARNLGVKHSKANLLFFCDADLELDPELLKKLENALNNKPSAAFAYCAFSWGGKIFAREAFDSDHLKDHNYISTMSLIRREEFPEFDESLERFQDWDLWLTITEKGGVGVSVPEVLFTVQTAGSMSRRGGLSRLRATKKVRKKHGLSMKFGDWVLALKESVLKLFG